MKRFIASKFRIKTNKIKIVLFLLLFLTSITLPLANPSTVRADENFNPLELSRAYQSATFIATCVKATDLRSNSGILGMNNGISVDDLKEGRFINDSKLSDYKDAIAGVALSIPIAGTTMGVGLLRIDIDKSVNVGYSIPEAKNGKLKCSKAEDIISAMQGTGLTYKELLVDSGLYQLDSNGSKYIVLEDPPKDESERAALILKAVFNKYPDLKDKNRLKVIQYYNLLESLDKCETFDDSNGLLVKFIEEPGGDPIKKYKGSRKGFTENTISVGVGMPGDGKHDGVMMCKTIIDQVNLLADDVAKIMKDLIDQGVAIDAAGSSFNGGDPDAGSPTCDMSGFNLSWIICPIVTGLSETSDTIFNDMVQPLLVSRDLGYTDSSGNNISSTTGNPQNKNLFQVWSTFRILANILLVAALLIIVIGQAIGGGMIDAYTVKKTLPKLVVAAILVNISVYLMAIALDVTNILGSGINSLLLAPLRGTDQAIVKLSSGGTAMITFTAGAGILALIAAAGSMGGLLLLFLLVAAILVLAVLAVLITLIIRQGIIIFLVITSPVAFVLYALPNTEQYFKKWWSLTFKTLLVYPIVMIILSMSYMMSVLISGTFPSGVQWIADVVSVLLLIIPLFLIPMAFKMAGGMTGTLFNALNNNPLNKLAKKGLQKQSLKGFKQSGHKLKSSEVFRGRTTGFRGALNRGAGFVGHIGSLGARPDQWRSRERSARQKYLTQAADEHLKADGGWTSGDDDSIILALRGVSGADFIDERVTAGRTVEQARDELTRLETSFGAKMGSSALRVAAWKAYATSSTAIGTDAEGKKAMIELGGELIRDGIMTSSDVMGSVKGNRSRADVAAMSFVEGMHMFEGAATGGVAPAGAGEAWQSGAYHGAKVNEVIASHTKTSEAFSAQARLELDGALAASEMDSTETTAQRELANLANYHSQLSSSSPKQADEFEQNVLSQDSGVMRSRNVIGADGEVTEEIVNLTYRELIDEARSNPSSYNTFHDRIREFSSAQAAAVGAAGGIAPDANGGGAGTGP